MEIFEKHQVKDMDESMVQRCINCNAIISDYRNTMMPAGQSMPKGFSAGYVYVNRVGKSCSLYQTEIPSNATIVDCTCQ